MTQEEELYGPEAVPRGEEVIPEERKEKTKYSPKTEIVYRMIAAKETLFKAKDLGGKNDEGIRVWKPDNNQHGTCIIGAMISADDAHFQFRDQIYKCLNGILLVLRRFGKALG